MADKVYAGRTKTDGVFEVDTNEGMYVVSLYTAHWKARPEVLPV